MSDFIHDYNKRIFQGDNRPATTAGEIAADMALEQQRRINEQFRQMGQAYEEQEWPADQPPPLGNSRGGEDLKVMLYVLASVAAIVVGSVVFGGIGNLFSAVLKVLAWSAALFAGLLVGLVATLAVYPLTRFLARRQVSLMAPGAEGPLAASWVGTMLAVLAAWLVAVLARANFEALGSRGALALLAAGTAIAFAGFYHWSLRPFVSGRLRAPLGLAAGAAWLALVLWISSLVGFPGTYG